MSSAQRHNLRELKEWFHYKYFVKNVNLIIYLLICPIILQVAVLGADSPILGVIRCLQAERIPQLDGAHGLGGIFENKVSLRRKINQNQCWSELFKLFEYSNSEDRIVVFDIRIRSIFKTRIYSVFRIRSKFSIDTISIRSLFELFE